MNFLLAIYLGMIVDAHLPIFEILFPFQQAFSVVIGSDNKQINKTSRRNHTLAHQTKKLTFNSLISRCLSDLIFSASCFANIASLTATSAESSARFARSTSLLLSWLF